MLNTILGNHFLSCVASVFMPYMLVIMFVSSIFYFKDEIFLDYETIMGLLALCVGFTLVLGGLNYLGVPLIDKAIFGSIIVAIFDIIICGALIDNIIKGWKAVFSFIGLLVFVFGFRIYLIPVLVLSF